MILVIVPLVVLVMLLVLVAMLEVVVLKLLVLVLLHVLVLVLEVVLLVVLLVVLVVFLEDVVLQGQDQQTATRGQGKVEKMFPVLGHIFVAQSFVQPVYCAVDNQRISGFGKQVPAPNHVLNTVHL